MEQLLSERLPWWVAGPGFGLVVVALYALVNEPMGVSGTYFQLSQWVRRRPEADVWRVWVLAGIAGGALAGILVRGGPVLGLGYGGWGVALPLALAVPLLFGGGLLMGYGARWAGGCTSGHGLSGTAALSSASFATAATFFAMAILVAAVLCRLSGGAL